MSCMHVIFLEHDPVDQQKEQYLEQDLMSAWNDQLAETSSMRVKGPRTVRKNMKRLFRHELQYIVSRVMVNTHY